MDGFEFNKFFMAATGALLAFLLLGFFSESVFHMEKLSEPAYSVATVETETTAEEETFDLATMLAEADIAKGEKTFKKCGACHKIEPGVNAVGPSLHGVVGRPIDSIADFGYSGALEQVGEVWSFDNLFHFLENPKAAAPGTSMSFAGLKKPQDRANVIAFLNSRSDAPLALPEAGAAPADKAEAEPTEGDGGTTEAAAAGAEPPGVAEQAAPSAAPAGFGALYAAADTAHGEKVFKKCKACHKLEAGAHGVGPSLYGVVGRAVASAEGFSYSKAMAEHGGAWDFATLDAYLTKPRDYVPGNKMSFAGLKKPGDRAAVIAYLNAHSDAPLAPPEGGDAAPGDKAEAPAPQQDAALPDTPPAPVAEAVEAAAPPPVVAVTPALYAPADEAAPPPEGFAALYAAADAASGAALFRKCAICHELAAGEHGVGPSLFGVVGREVAYEGTGFRYSQALKSRGGFWDYAALDAYLAKPRRYIPGNVMSFAGLSRPEDRAAVIRYINEAGGESFAAP